MSSDRREFLKTGCKLCIGAFSAGLIFSSSACKTSGGLYAGKTKNGFLVVPLKAFSGSKMLMVQTINFREPLLLVREGDGKAHALLMRCTHRNTQLELTGDQLICPAHGSIFDTNGKVLQSPASDALTSFSGLESEKDIQIKIE